MNPYRVVEKVARIAGWSILGLVTAVTITVVLSKMAAACGWFSLAWVLVGLLAIVILTVLGVLIRDGLERLKTRWNNAKYEWDDHDDH